MSDVVPLKRGRGGYRAGAGRKPSHLKMVGLKGNFIYVIHEQDDPTVCKIGVAIEPHRRIATLQVATWRRLRLAAIVSVPNSLASTVIESSVHGILSGIHVSGEWFRVSADRAVTEILSAANSLGIEAVEHRADFQK